MERQLVLIEPTDHDWRLDDHTKLIGRRGVEQARRRLQDARRTALEAQAGDDHASAA